MLIEAPERDVPVVEIHTHHRTRGRHVSTGIAVVAALPGRHRSSAHAAVTYTPPRCG